MIALALPGGKPDAGGGATGSNALGAEDVMRDPSVPYALYEAPGGTGGWVVLDKVSIMEARGSLRRSRRSRRHEGGVT